MMQCRKTRMNTVKNAKLIKKTNVHNKLYFSTCEKQAQGRIKFIRRDSEGKGLRETKRVREWVQPSVIRKLYGKVASHIPKQCEKLKFASPKSKLGNQFRKNEQSVLGLFESGGLRVILCLSAPYRCHKTWPEIIGGCPDMAGVVRPRVGCGIDGNVELGRYGAMKIK